MNNKLFYNASKSVEPSRIYRLLKLMCYTLVLIFFLLPTKGIAQVSSTGKQNFSKIYRILTKDDALKFIEGGQPVYAFNFRIEVKKNKTGKQIIKVIASDSLAYKLFPSYKEYYNFDFTEFLNSKGEVNFIFPIVISNEVNLSRKSEHERPSIDALHVVELLLSALKVGNPYKNSILLHTLEVQRLSIPKDK